MNRRQLLKLSAVTGIGLLIPAKWYLQQDTPVARAYSSSSPVTKFAQPLRGVFPIDSNGIPVAIPDGTRAWKNSVPAQHYTIDINQYEDTLHPSLGGKTTLWGYHSRNNLGGTVPQRHLGGIIVAQKGTPVQITFQNNLPNQHILPVDPTIMGVMDNQVNRTCVHFHGGEVPWISDGGPFAWFDNAGNYGPSAKKGRMNIYKTVNPGLKPGQAEVYYPNNQSARMGWYHDHAVGITRLNAYAGIASAYIIRDQFEGNLRNLGLPDFIENGGREIPLVIQDKVFVDTRTIGAKDPGWTSLPVPQGSGSLWYPHTYEPGRWDLGQGMPLQDPSIIPEMFGDIMLTNGTAYPNAVIEPRRYRIRLLDACQARFLNLQLYVEDSSGNSITFDSSGNPTNAKGPDWLVIGSEGGFLAKPVVVPSNVPFNPLTMSGSLIVAPGVRFDIIVDFKDYAGKKLVLYNDAPAPFPMGAPENDVMGSGSSGPNTRQIMRFEVAAGITGPADPPMRITTATPLAMDPRSGTNWPLPVMGSLGRQQFPSVTGFKVRQVTLNEVYDEYGRLIQMLGTNTPWPLRTGFSQPTAGVNYARSYDDPATEVTKDGEIEIWQVVNLTGDTHPMHWHLVNVQVLSRRPFNADIYNGTPAYTGPARGPEATELGWKETVMCHPGEVTTVIMRVSLPNVPFKVPASPRTGGHEYVWHCHILEHEEHDMMRPFIVG